MGKKKFSMDDIPITSFGDLAFLLIIFFILVTSLQQIAGFKTDIPAADSAPQATADKMPTIKLHDGLITYDEQNISIEQLGERLRGLDLAKKPEPARIVVIEATGRVNYQEYYQAMAAVTKAGGVIGIVKEND